MPELQDMDVTRARAVALYTFLKEFTELRTKTVRSVDQYDQVLWFSDVPEQPGCDCAARHRGRDEENGEVWLEIHQPRLVSAPKPPAELEPWLVREQITDSSIEMPELRDEIELPIQDESGEKRFERRAIRDWLDIKESWGRYVEARWWPWAEADRRAQSVQRAYTQLFSIYQKQQRLGEQYEVVLGLGLLSWRTSDGQEIRRHLVAARANVAFDAARSIMTVRPAGEGAQPLLEQDMLNPELRPDPEQLRAFETQLAEVSSQLWDPAFMDAILAGWVHSVSPRGIYDEGLSRPDKILSDPQVHLAPALILRRRTERSYLRAFDEIIRQLESGASIPPGVSRFVTITEDPVHSRDQQDPPSASTSADDMYFPLESNEAQRQILARLASHQGVLVQGPPGTGKSHTIVNLICHLLASGQRILVTSHTARALKVLQRFIREKLPEISPLAVVLLGDDLDALHAMEDSVQGITDYQNRWEPNVSAQRIEELEAQLIQARREEAKVLSDLRAIRERETYVHPAQFGAYEGTLQTIATRLREEENGFERLEDRPTEWQEPPLSSQQFQDLLVLLRDAELNEWQSTGWNALECRALPSPKDVAVLVNREVLAQEEYDRVAHVRSRPEYAPLAAATTENRERLIREISELLVQADQISQHLHAWPKQAVREILGDHDRAWRDLLDVTKAHLSQTAGRARWADETPISGLGERDHHEVRADAEAMLAHMESGRGWGLGWFRAGPAKRAQYLRRDVKVAGKACATPEELKSLISWLDVENRLGMLRERWAHVHHIAAASAFSTQVHDLEDLCEPLESALALYERKLQARAAIQTVSGLSEPIWHEPDQLQWLRDCAAAVDLNLGVHDAAAALAQTREQLAVQVSQTCADPAGKDLLRALEARDVRGYEESYSRVCRNEQFANGLMCRESLLSQLRGCAPLLGNELARTFKDEAWDRRASRFEAAWNWARTVVWLERLSDPGAEQQLRIQLDSARGRIRNRLVTV
ncbi:MAG: hypothetical protein EPO21_17415 [Chloroflexota bacterium]|nr:MAG: hypothetical protein EPO21_17415 [Chloroflexota bacterium]